MAAASELAAGPVDVPMLDGNTIRIRWPQTRPGLETRYRARTGTVHFQERRHQDNVYLIEFQRRSQKKQARMGTRLRKSSWACISKRKYEVVESKTPRKLPRTKWTDAERTAVRVRTDAGEVAKSIGLGIGRSDNAINSCRAQFNSSYAPRVGDGSRTKSGVTIRMVERAMLTLSDHAGTGAQVYGAVLKLAANVATPLDTGLAPGKRSITRAEKSVAVLLCKNPQFVEAGKVHTARRPGKQYATIYKYITPDPNAPREQPLIPVHARFHNRKSGEKKVSERRKREKLCGGDRRFGD